ncbi:MAG: DNA-binding MarR family transcriptional regulator/GNAT superfamily N-acetyltransferase [Flavobacterium sp.]|jgi:DNA-binding MarR family transcriptional regulator/GNAT superfamily N-acetyltransferase
MDLLRELGALGLGSRLKRLSDQLMQDGIRIYRETGLKFEPKWFPVYCYLSEMGPSSVTEVAKGLGVTHPSVNQVAREMIKDNLVAAYKDTKDKRKRVLALTAFGKEKRKELDPIWRDVRAALQELLDETQVDFLGYVESLERALDKKSFLSRFQSRYAPTEGSRISIVSFRPELAPHFKKINTDWIVEDFELEDVDRETLDNPIEKVISSGGQILFAVDKESAEVYGTCALINRGQGSVELAKMGVTKAARGQGIGKILGLMAISFARDMGFKLIYLETNSRLAPALGLYRQIGFVRKSPPKKSDYARSDVYMNLNLTNE